MRKKSEDMALLIIYTGGTIGMVRDPATNALHPFDFSHVEDQVPELKSFGCHIDTITFSPLIDSSDVKPEFWERMVRTIEQHYEAYDGFIILHGTDTMAYTASALSFMLENLQKPVILTGSQLPIGTLRTDGKENLITAIEIATAHKDGQPMVPEVALYFENQLYRGNRTTKTSSEHFNAFSSPNYPQLADIGINIKYNYGAIRYPTSVRPLRIHPKLETNIAVLKIYPGISENMVRAVTDNNEARAVILETYGSGNATTEPWFLESIRDAVKHGKVVVNITQCLAGKVDMTKYENGQKLLEAGVMNGYDLTTEAGLTKLMFLLGMGIENNEIASNLNKSLRGEITV
jgi:L-asparaginase